MNATTVARKDTLLENAKRQEMMHVIIVGNRGILQMNARSTGSDIDQGSGDIGVRTEGIADISEPNRSMKSPKKERERK